MALLGLIALMFAFKQGNEALDLCYVILFMVVVSGDFDICND